jgi:hypothetical protein
MTLIDEFKKQVAQTTDLAKLKTLASIAGARIKAIEAAPAEEAPAAEESAEEIPEVASEGEEFPEAEQTEGEIPEVESGEESVESVEQAVEEPVAPVRKALAKAAPAPAKKAPPPKPVAKPKLAVGSRVYGPPVPIKFKFRNADKQVMNAGDMYSFEGKIESIEGDRAILAYTDKERPLGLGKDAPVRVRVALSALEPVA